MKYGRYEVTDRLGEGVSAVVFRAQDPLHGGREVALKVLKEQDERAAARFRHEFQILAGLRHPNLIGVYDFGVGEDGSLYYSSEFRAGERTLRTAVLEGEVARERAERIALMVEVLRGLEFVHARGIVHRDLKPANLLVEVGADDGAPRVRIGDFGMVGAAAGEAAGTPQYMAPEVLRRRRVDRRCDLYAVGVILYELLTGELPYDGHTPQEVARRHLEDRPRPPRELAPDLPEALERVVLRLLAKEPSHRYPSANAVIAALAEATGVAYAFETCETTEAYVLSGKLVGRDREIDWLTEAFLRATQPRAFALDPREFDRRARFRIYRGSAEGDERRRGGDRRRPDEAAPAESPPALTVFLRGPSGVGKTRLLDELRRRGQLEGATVLRGSCRKHLARSYEPFIAAFQEAARRDALSAALAGYEGALGQLLGRSDAPPAGDGERLRLIDALAECLIGCSTDQPLILLLEDLQWARAETLDLLIHLHRTLGALLTGADSREALPRLFVVATYRVDEVVSPGLSQALRALRHDRFFEELGLDLLKPDDAAELVRSMLGLQTVPRPFIERVMDETQGNPLLIELLMEELAGRGVIDRSRGLWRLDPKRLEALEVPARLHDLVLSRLERLEQRPLLEWLAVLDRATPPALVAELAGTPREAALAALEELAQRQLVVRHEGGTYELAHARVRDVVYGALAERAPRHARVAEALERAYDHGEPVTLGELAHHLLEAGAGLEAIAWARRAGEEASAVGAAERACELFSRALRAVEDALVLAEHDPIQTKRLREEKLVTIRALVHEQTRVGRIAEARALTVTGLEVARALGDGPAEVAALAHLGSLNARLKAADDAKRCYFEALKTAERLEYGKGIGLSLLGLGDLTLTDGHLEEAQEYLERTLAFGEDLGDSREISRYLRGLANAHAKQGRPEDAIRFAERALDQDLGSEDRKSQVESLELLAQLCYVQGNHDRVVDAAEQALAVAEVLDDKPAVARALLALGSAHERLGQRRDATRRLGEALELTRRLGLGAELAQALNGMGWVHLLAGDVAQALAAFNEATTLWNTQEDKDGYAVGLINLGRVHGRRGDLTRAAACYDAALRVSWEVAARASELEATWGRAAIHALQGDAQRAREALDKTVLRAREQRIPRLEALALADLGRLLAAEGEGQRGLRAVRRARALARDLKDDAVDAVVALRAAQVDRLRGALAPALEALRSRDAWLSAARDRLLAIEGELAFGLAAADLGETDAAERALRAAYDEAHARGLGPLEAQVLLALGTLHRERALAGTTGRRGGRGPAPSPASLGSARAAFKQAHERAKALGYGPAEAEAELAVARLDLLDGDEDACRVRVGRVRDGLGAEQRALQAECAALEVELLAGRDPEQAIVRADEVDAQTPALRLRLALLREAASRDAGSRLEAQAALAEANAALDDLRAGLDSADRAQLERTWLAVAVADARRTRAAEAGEATPSRALAGARALDFLRAVREVNGQKTAAAQRRAAIDRALALFGAGRGLLVAVTSPEAPGEEAETEVVAAREAPGRDLTAARETSRTVVADAALRGDVVIVQDAQANPPLSERPSVADLGLRSVLAIPLRCGARSPLVLVLEDREAAGRFSDDDRELAEAYGELVAQALERTRLEAQSRAASAELATARRDQDRLERALEAERRERSEAVESAKAERVTRDLERGLQASYADMVGQSEPMLRVFALLDKVKRSDVPLLVQGESGTGKELVARAAHAGSPRKDRPFLSVNVAALPESLLEAELFGHVKGAFTGADQDKVGLFEAAHTGTLFLDEVGEMPPAMQSKLLRVLQEGEVRPIGTRKARKVDVRIVSASNKDLRKLVDEGRFRADLFYRLNVVSVSLPPLRERKEDIPLLVDALLVKISERVGEKLKAVDRKVRDCLIHYDWPGNVRELENELRRLVALSGARITERDLSSHIRRRPATRLELTPTHEDGLTLKERMERIERRILVEALGRHENNKTRTAKALGLSRFGFLKKLDKYRLREELPK